MRETKRLGDEGTEGLKGEGGMGRRGEGEKTPHSECYFLDLLRVTPSFPESFRDRVTPWLTSFQTPVASLVKITPQIQG